MGMFGMDDDLNRMIDTHPLTVFSKLLAENPENKVYRQCLDSEVKTAAESLSEHLSAEQIEVFDRIVGILPDELLVNADGEIGELFINVSVMRKILAEVRRIKGIN